MVFRDVQRLEVVVVILHLGALDDLEAEADEDVLKLGLHQRERVTAADGCGLGGQGDVHRLRLELCLKRRLMRRRLFLLNQILDVGAHVVGHLTDFRSFLGGELPHAAQHACQLAFLAEVLHAQSFEVSILLAELCRRLGLDLFQHFFQIETPPFYIYFLLTTKNRPEKRQKPFSGTDMHISAVPPAFRP